jgi:predicted nucleic acid-binding protein
LRVVDPNVLVAAAITDGVSARLLHHWLTVRSFEIVVCPMLIAELRDVLGRDKFRRWITEREAAPLIERLESEAEAWGDPVEIPESTPDPKDDYLVALYRDRARRGAAPGPVFAMML